MLPQQIISQQKEKINLLYGCYCKDLDSYETSKDFTNADRSGREFFNYLEQCCAESNSDEEMRKNAWNQWLAETCYDTLKLLVIHYQTYREDTNNHDATPSETAYAAMQRMVKSYSPRKKTKEIITLLRKNNLPTYGFDINAKVDSMKILLSILVIISSAIIFISAYFFSAQIPIPLVIGLCLFVVVFISCLYIKKPSGMQYFILRTSFSACIPGLLVSYPGFVEVTFKQLGFEISAIGLLAIFIVIYKMNPAKLSELDK